MNTTELNISTLQQDFAYMDIVDVLNRQDDYTKTATIGTTTDTIGATNS